uniref:F-box domain-containing protein n=1 Tax=Caenorhabditis tropicalis TaxID=1561998 RepID=A0A1I7UT87_9PELO
MPFLLLRLPCLALEEIVKNWDHKEILFLAETSQKARRLISRHTNSYFVKITVIDEYFATYIQMFYTDGKHFHTSWRFKTLLPIFYDYERNDVLSCWRQDEQAVQEILNLLNDILRIELVSFINNSNNACRLVPIAEYVVLKNLKIGRVDWGWFSGDEEMEERLLMVSKDATNFKMEKFGIRFDHFHLFKMDRFEIENAEWMTVDQVIALRNCKKIRLRSVCFGSTDINKILLEYMENPGELQELRLSSSQIISLREVVTGLNAVEVR